MNPLVPWHKVNIAMLDVYSKHINIDVFITQLFKMANQADGDGPITDWSGNCASIEFEVDRFYSGWLISVLLSRPAANLW